MSDHPETVFPRMVFLGFRAKRPWRPDSSWDADGPSGVSEVCSAADCLALPPPDWIARWDFNRAGCYATAEAAIAAVPVDLQAQHQVFGYWLVSNDDDEGFVLPDGLPQLPRYLEPSELELIGFDIVQCEAGLGPTLPVFGCSPLSCNLCFRHASVNRYCLIDDLGVALQLVAQFNDEQPETGYYRAVLIGRAAVASGGEVGP